LNQAGDAELLRVGRHTTFEELRGAFETRRREWSTKRAILENEPSLVKKVDEIQVRLETAFQRMASQQKPIVAPPPRRATSEEKWIMESPTEPEIARRGSGRSAPAAADTPRERPSGGRAAAVSQEPNPVFDPFADRGAEPPAHRAAHSGPDFQLPPPAPSAAFLKSEPPAPAAEKESPESTQPPTVFLPAADGEELLDEVGIQLDANPPSTAEYSQPGGGDEVEATAAATIDDIDRLPRAALAGLTKEQKYEKTKQLYRDVQLHFQVRDYEGAISLLYELIKLSPTNGTYHGLLAKAMLKHPVMRKNAERHFVEALRLDPENADLHYSLGVYYKAFGFHSRAITQFRTALRIDPRHEKAKKGLSADAKKDSIKDMFRKIFS